MAVEGTLRVGLRVDGATVAGVHVRSTRPDVAQALLSGRTRAEVAAAVPLLFSICGRSQAAASALACAAAAGEAPDGAVLARARDAVAAEMLREAAWRTLLDWPRAVGEVPDAAAVAAARLALAPLDGAARDTIAHAAFGLDAAAFLALDDVEAVERWCDRGATAAARFVRSVRDAGDVDRAAAATDASRPARGDPGMPWLAGQDAAPRVPALVAAIDAEADFAQHPHWQGSPAETGALARWRDDPPLRALVAHDGDRTRARFVARLRELARLLVGDADPAVGVLALAGGDAVAWVDNARGLLLHRVRIDGARPGARIARYVIVAPTEWNFHPAGALASALAGSPAGDPDVLRQRATRLIHSLDPCVACEVTVDDA